MINKIKNNKISEISAKNDLNTLNEIKNAGITKQKRCALKQKELLNQFNGLSDIILTDKTLESKSQKDDENENENVNENENENVNENDKILMSIFDHTLEALANKLINTTNKEENQITVNDINKSKDKLYEQDDFGDWVIQSSDLRIDLKDAIDLILDFNEETIQSDLV